MKTAPTGSYVAMTWPCLAALTTGAGAMARSYMAGVPDADDATLHGLDFPVNSASMPKGERISWTNSSGR